MTGWIGRWVRRARYFFRRSEEESDVAEEMRVHIDLETEALIRRGMDPTQARRQAAIRFGGSDRYREQVREARGVRWIDDLAKDLRFAVRTLRRHPGFALSGLLVLAVGIGTTTTMFGVVKAVLLDPLPYPDSDRLVRVWQAAPARGALRGSFSVPDFRDWRDRSRTLEKMAVYTTILSDAVLTADGPAEEVGSVYVAGDFFGTFGVAAALGRVPTLDDEARNPRVVALSHGYWQRRFGGDPDVVGRTLTLEGQPFEVVGVMPPGFSAPVPGVEAWLFLETVPQGSVPHRERYVRFLRAVGRLTPGTTVDEATAELSTIAAGLEAAYPEVNEGLDAATVVPLRDDTVGGVAASLWLALGAVGFLLAIACANVAGLLLARASERRGEVAVRMSLGAGRARVVRQLLVEAGILSAAGGILGFGLAWLGTGLLRRSAADFVPRAAEVGIDAGILGFAVLVTGAASIFAGLVPARRAAALEPAPELREGGRSATGARSTSRLRRAVVGTQVAVAAVLLVGAALMARSLGALSSVDPGFEAEEVAAMTLTLNLNLYPSRGEYLAYYNRLLERLAALPGVSSVGSVRFLPTRGVGESAGLSIPGVWEPGPEDDPFVDVVHVGGDVFDALGTDVSKGRTFRATDDEDAEFAVVINEAMERGYFGGADPLDRILDLGGREARVVGVVEDIRHEGLDIAAGPVVYIHMQQNSRVGMAILARTDGDPAGLLPEMRAAVLALEPDQPITELTSLSSALAGSIAQDRFLTFLFVSFALLATLLSALGVYGVIAFTVRRRLRDMGLRMALGAGAGDVVVLVVRQGMAPALVGLAVGLGGAASVAHVMRSLLFEVTPLDGWSFAAAAALLGASAFTACLVPAFRASRLEPMKVLRSE